VLDGEPTQTKDTGREVASALRRVAEMFAEVRDGKTASYVLGVLARLLDPA
jgi:hypothetical protein